MADTVYTPIVLGNEFNYALPSSLPSCRNTEIRINPMNGASFSAGNVIQCEIPCGGNKYLDTSTVYIKFKATFTHAGVISTDKSYLLGSGYSYFNKQEIIANSSLPIETITEPGVLANMLFNAELSHAEKNALSSSFGFGFSNTSIGPSSATAGHAIFSSVANLENLIFSYSIPLIGILGAATTKMIPLFAIYGLRLELTMDSYSNFVYDTTTNLTTGCTISDFELVGNLIELSPESQALVLQANPNNIYIRTQSYRTSTNTLAASSSAGTYDLLLGARVSSCKSILVTCAVSNAVEKKFSSVNPNLDAASFLLNGGISYPSRPINVSANPSDSFLSFQKSLGSLNLINFNGTMNKLSYYTGSTSYGLCTAYNATSTNILVYPNQWYFGVDCESVAHRGGLLSGISINQSSSFFRAIVGSQLSAYVHTLYFFVNHDVILQFDLNAKTVVSKY